MIRRLGAGERLEPRGADPVEHRPWTCSACTYENAGSEATYLQCAVCGSQRQA